MDDRLLQLVTEGVFLTVFVLTLVDLAHRPRDRRRLEIVALFGALAVVVVLQGLTQLTGVAIRRAETIEALLIVAQPYLLLRLVEHFRPVPRWQHATGIVLLAGSWAIILAAGPDLPAWASLGLVLAFA